MTEDRAEAFGELTGAADQAARDARQAADEVRRLSTALNTGLGRALSRLILDGARATDVMRGLATSLSRTVLSAALKPVQTGLSHAVSTGVSGLVSGAVGVLGFAKGGVVSGRAGALPPAALQSARAFARGGVLASGGVVREPTLFQSAAGLGLMGEAGPEAILPLARGADGRLGVRAPGRAAGPPVQIAIHARDADSFRRSRTQIAAQLARALDRGRRAL